MAAAGNGTGPLLKFFGWGGEVIWINPHLVESVVVEERMVGKYLDLHRVAIITMSSGEPHIVGDTNAADVINKARDATAG